MQPDYVRQDDVPDRSRTPMQPMAMIEAASNQVGAAYRKNPMLFIVGVGAVAGLVALSMRTRGQRTDSGMQDAVRSFAKASRTTAAQSSSAVVDQLSSAFQNLASQNPDGARAMAAAAFERMKSTISNR